MEGFTFHTVPHRRFDKFNTDEMAVVGIDITPTFIDFWQNFKDRNRLNFDKQNLVELPVGNSAKRIPNMRLLSYMASAAKMAAVVTSEIHFPGNVTLHTTIEGMERETWIGEHNLASIRPKDLNTDKYSYDDFLQYASAMINLYTGFMLWGPHSNPANNWCLPHWSIMDAFHQFRGMKMHLIKGEHPWAVNPRIAPESFSAEQTALGDKLGLKEWLKANKKKVVILYGVAGSHCMGWTAYDLRKAGFTVIVVSDAQASITLTDPGAKTEGWTFEQSMVQMLWDEGVIFTDTLSLLEMFQPEILATYGQNWLDAQLELLSYPMLLEREEYYNSLPPELAEWARTPWIK